MEIDRLADGCDDLKVPGVARGLAALAGINFGSLDPVEILAVATNAVATLAPCRVEASYRAVEGGMVLCPPSQSERPDLKDTLQRSRWNGRIDVPQQGWAWAFALCHREGTHGCLLVSATAEPTPGQFMLMDRLAQQTGAALSCAELHQHDARRAKQLEESNENLTHAVQRLEAQTYAHELLGAALAAGAGEQGIADALHRLTGRSVCVEDRFGNLRAWAGPSRPLRYPKPTPDQRDRFLHQLSARPGPVRSGGRVSMLIQPHADTLGVLALIDPDEVVDDDQLFALRYGSSVLGLVLSHQRNLAELQLNLRRELVEDLLAGTDNDGAYARAAALGYDLRSPHYVVVVHSARGADNTGIAAAGRASARLHLNHLLGRQGSLIVLLTDGRPDPDALYREVSRQLRHSASAIGIGSRCNVPSELPQSFRRARRALNIRLHSANPRGASAYDELGFYHLVDAAHSAGTADEYTRQWLGVLIDYDAAKNSDLVRTLSHYLECGGNYDESAATLHIHRSTLRYRLGRITELTGFDLRNIDTRFNLHAATRAWRFLSPEP
jgi:PucR C-terminal helix-turn-helix domain/GGDEF-like domain